MWRQIQGKFIRKKARLDVVRKMIELGIGIDREQKLMVGRMPVTDSALAMAANVDRRVVRNTVNQIFSDPNLRVIFTNVKPIGTSLVEIADKIGYGVLVINADPLKLGVISVNKKILDAQAPNTLSIFKTSSKSFIFEAPPLTNNGTCIEL